MKLFRSSNINVVDECNIISCYPSKRLKKEESVLRVNSQTVSVCRTILTFVRNYVNIVTADYL